MSFMAAWKEPGGICHVVELDTYADAWAMVFGREVAGAIGVTIVELTTVADYQSRRA